MGRLTVLIVALALALAGCAPERALPAPTPSTTPSASPTAVEDDSAAGRRAIFDLTNNATISLADGAPLGRDFIDSLVGAGFDRSKMMLTPDTTAIGLKADNIQFSVQIDDDCLVGQFGNVGYASAILPVVSPSGCLIGNTRPIDW